MKDPSWDRYFVWPWDYFPIQLPACLIKRDQAAHERSDVGVVVWRMERGVPLIARVDDADGNVLEELLPQPNKGEHNGPSTPFETTHVLDRDGLTDIVGFGFTWSFYVPIVDYIPQHPLGIVRVESKELLGRVTSITINGQRRPPRSNDEDTHRTTDTESAR